MAHRTRRSVEASFAAAVVVEEAGYVMAGGPEVDAGGMALLAAEGRLDFVMAHEAVCHPWERRLGYGIRLLEAPVAGGTGIFSAQVREYVARVRKIGF
jgi:hypothetical protein